MLQNQIQRSPVGKEVNCLLGKRESQRERESSPRCWCQKPFSVLVGEEIVSSPRLLHRQHLSGGVELSEPDLVSDFCKIQYLGKATIVNTWSFSWVDRFFCGFLSCFSSFAKKKERVREVKGRRRKSVCKVPAGEFSSFARATLRTPSVLSLYSLCSPALVVALR